MSKYNYTLKKKTSLVTGAAGYLGEIISETLSGLESNIILVDSDKKKLTKVATKIKLVSNYKVDIIACDLTLPSSIKKIKDYIVKNYGQLDVLVNSIGLVYRI